MFVPKIVSIVGARPQFIKAAAVSRIFRQQSDIIELLVHTGQHFDQNMSDVFFEELGMPEPAYNLHLGGGSHGKMTGRMLEALEDILINEQPQAVIVYGDTNSTLAGALAAVKLHIPVVHVEAGLRSFNKRMPEEINRILCDHASTLLLCPTRSAAENLRREGIHAGVREVGDVMYDATLYAISRSAGNQALLHRLGLGARPFAVCTLHRAENTDDRQRLQALIEYIRSNSEGMDVVFPVHPRTAKKFIEFGINLDGVQIIDPLGYFDLHTLLAGCTLVFTDSGGLQKEAYFHRKPCITMRDETEWVELVDSGWNRLWTASDWVTPRTEVLDYGNGHAASAVVDAVRAHLNMDFVAATPLSVISAGDL